MPEALTAILVAVGIVVLLAFAAIRIVPEYERGVIFRLGRIIGAKGPGLFIIIPVVDRMVKVSLRIVTMDIPPQDIITRDNVTVRVNAVSYFKVVDPNRSVVSIENHITGTSQIAQTTLRSVLGQHDLDELLSKRDEINQRLQQLIDEVTDAWGVKVTQVEVKHVELPDTMRRAMAAQAEAERERRAKVIHAQGEYEAAETLGSAAEILEVHPAAMQLRTLSTMSEISAERNSTLIFPLPMEILRLVDTLSGNGAGPAGGTPTASSSTPATTRPEGAPPNVTPWGSSPPDTTPDTTPPGGSAPGDTPPDTGRPTEG